MPVVHNLSSPSASLTATSACFDSADCVDMLAPEIWFDAIDHVELDNTWFDAHEAGFDAAADDLNEAHVVASKVEEMIPFTEDCRRCIKELIRHLGEVKENELLFIGLSKMFPGLPVDVMLTARSLYVAVMERRNIDIAVLNTLGLAASYFPGSAQAIVSMARYMQETLGEYAGQFDAKKTLRWDEDNTFLSIFTGLAVLAIVAKHWITDEGAPQRRLLRLPAFLANLLLRVNYYWSHLHQIAQYAAQTCHLALSNDSGQHHYRCVEESHLGVAEKSKMTAQKSWHCTIMEKETEPTVAGKSCVFSRYPGLSHNEWTRSATGKRIRQAYSVAAATAGNEVMQPLMAAAVTAAGPTVAASRYVAWNSGLVRAAALTFAGAAALVGGKFIRDAIFFGRNADDRSHAGPTPQALVTNCDELRSVVDEAPSAVTMPSHPQPPMLCRNRLIGYLHEIAPFPTTDTSDFELAQAALRLLQKDDKHQAALARIALYGTGLFGERHDEYLESSAQQLLVGDLLSKLLFDQRSLENYLLDEFAVNRRITIVDFHKKITTWSFEKEEPELQRFFNERFLLPVMPMLKLNLQHVDSDDENRLILVGSPTWIFIYMGTQFMWSAGAQKEKYDIQEMMLFGGYIFGMLKKKRLIEGSSQVLAPGFKLAGLFSNSEWTSESLPELAEMQALVCAKLETRIKEDSKLVEQFDIAKKKLEEALKVSWFSRKKMAEELLLRYCGKTGNVQLFEEFQPEGASGDGKVKTKKAKPIMQKNKNSIEILLNRQTNVYCINQRRQIIKVPTVNYKYRSAIVDIVNALKSINSASLNQVLSVRDVYREDFSYDDYGFIEQAALTWIDVFIGRERDIREQLAFGPLIETWKPKSTCIFFNATLGDETRTYAVNGTADDYAIKRLNASYLLQELKPYFDLWPPKTLNTIRVVIATDRDSIKKSLAEPISVFIERLTEKKYRNNVDVLYEAGYDMPFEEKVYAFLKDVIIPFYTCISSLQTGDADNAVVSCVLDSAFVLGPFARGGAKIAGRAVKSTSKKILAQLVVAPNFIAGASVTTRKTIRFKDFIPRFNIYADSDIWGAGKSVIYLTLNALDPGFSLFINSRKTIIGMGKMFVSGNAMAAFSHITSNWKHVIEVGIRVQSIDDARKVFVRVSKMNNWGGDFEMEFNSTAQQLDFNNYKADASFLALVYIHDGYYNIFRLDQTEISFPASETGEVSTEGKKVYAMLSTNAPTGIFLKYVCTQSVSTVCSLLPWTPPETNAAIIKPTKVESKSGWTDWRFADAKHVVKFVIYPGYQCEIVQHGYTPSKLYEIIEIDNIHYIFHPNDAFLRPLRAGDSASIVPRRSQEQTISIERNFSGEIVISQIDILNLSLPSSFFHNENYRLKNDACDIAEATLSTQTGRLIAKIKNHCFSLQLAPLRNRFIINSHHIMQSSVKVGWSSEEGALIPAKPFIGESSVHAGISLEDFIGRRKANCQGRTIEKMPTELVSGAVWHDGSAWLKVLGRSYRLGTWREELCPLYCDSENRVVAWLRYDLFTESFDLVHEGADWRAADFKQRESIFEKTARKLRWSEIERWSILSDQSETKKMMLRMHQTAFLQSLDSVNRMEFLSLPAAHLRSWKLHADATPLLREYPALAFGVSQFRQMTSSRDGVTPNQLRFLYQMSLQNDFVRTYPSLGKLIPGKNGEHEAVWQTWNSEPLILKRYQFHFYSEHVTSNDGKMIWVPQTVYAPAVSVTQFMQDIYHQPHALTDIYRNRVWISHGEWGQLALQRDKVESKINYVFVSPNGNWVGLIDSTDYLTLFSLRQETDGQGNDTAMQVSAMSSEPISGEVKQSNLALAIVNDEGEFYYPAQLSWRSLKNGRDLWLAPLDFQPLFSTLDQRFYGFAHPHRSGVLVYDAYRKKAVFLRRPIFEYTWSALVAVAFSPLNALVALAFNDGQVYLYDLNNKIANADLDPISHVKLKQLFYVDHRNAYPYRQSIVIRFSGVFRYLTVIYDAGFFSLNKAFDKKNLSYDIYGFLPAEHQNDPDNIPEPASTLTSTSSTSTS